MQPNIGSISGAFFSEMSHINFTRKNRVIVIFKIEYGV